jgi:hypothetical protein
LETIFFIVLDYYFVGIQEKESWEMNTEEKIKAAGKKKEEGNALFKLGKYTRASKRYEKVKRGMRLHELKIDPFFPTRYHTNLPFWCRL